VIGTDGTNREDVKFYSMGSVPLAYIRTKSRVSFTLPVVDTMMTTVDTVYHIEMRPYGPLAADIDPQGAVLKDNHLNYFLPHCGTGIPNVPGYSRVVYENIFPFVDLHFYSGGFGQKMALVCRPGCNLADVKFRFAGQDSLNLDLWGNLKLFSNGKYFILPHAVAYQVNSDNTTIPVSWGANYQADEDAGLVSFYYSQYDQTKPLVLLIGPPPAMGGQNNTPGVCWSTYLGGDGHDVVIDSDVDEYRNYYTVGQTFSQSINFPIFTGVVYYQASPMAFMSKFDLEHVIEWSTFYGGSYGIQAATCIQARPGAEPNVLVGGYVNANDLFVVSPSDGRYYDPASSGGGFLAELSATGEAVWSTYIGSGNMDVLDLDLHDNGQFAVVGHAEWNLPEEQVTPDPDAVHWSYVGSTNANYPGDGYIVLFNAARKTIWSTYIGGNKGESIETVRFGDEKIVIAGQTTSTNIPLQDGGSNAYDETAHGSSDIIIMEFDMVGRLNWSTYFGGNLGESIGDQGLAIQQASSDGFQDVFIVGMSSSDDLPLENGTNWHDDTFKPGLQGYILRISGEDRSIAWLTYAKGLGTIEKATYMNTVAIDGMDRIFVGGTSWDPSFPLVGAPGVYSPSSMYGVGDGVIMCFSNTQDLRWSTYFGGQESGFYGDEIRTLALDGLDRLYAAGRTYAAYSTNSFFPFTDPLGEDDWFDSSFYPTSDGFLAAFCIDGALTSVNNLVQIDTGHLIQQLGPTQFRVNGLTGNGVLQITDARGRLVSNTAYRDHRSAVEFDLVHNAPGVYLVNVVGKWATRIVIQ